MMAKKKKEENGLWMKSLLGIVLGISLEIQNVNFFLIDKIWKFGKYWNTICLSIVGRRVIVNSILAFTL